MTSNPSLDLEFGNIGYLVGEKLFDFLFFYREAPVYIRFELSKSIYVRSSYDLYKFEF